MSDNVDPGEFPDNPPPGSLKTPREAAAYLGVSIRWLQGNPTIPFVDLALPGRRRRMIRYRVEDLDDYASSRRRSNGKGGRP